MAITHELVRRVARDLYEGSLKKVPEDTKAALRRALKAETSETSRKTLQLMIDSAEAAQANQKLVCSDSGVPVYFVKVGARAGVDIDVRGAITESFADLVATIDPPILKHVTNPLTLERGYSGKSMPIITFDMVGDSDKLDILCSPKALGSGRWAALEIFSFPTLDTIERYIMERVIKAGSQHCPPVIIGIGIGGTFDYAAKMAKEATLRPLGTLNPDPTLAAMETRLLEAVNATGFGPMGTGGLISALGVHIDYSAGHGFTPVAICFNCWINRRMGARIARDGSVEYYE